MVKIGKYNYESDVMETVKINKKVRDDISLFCKKKGINKSKLIEEFYNHDKGIVIPTYQGRRGHPTIFAIKYRGKLLGLKGDIGGRQIVKDHPGDILEVTVDSESIVTDIDTINDYQSLLD